MFIKTVRLNDFRSHKATSIEFGHGINVLLGGNGTGKTNLLEAINYATRNFSHKTSNKKALIRKGAECASIQLVVHKESFSFTIQKEITTTTKKNQNTAPQLCKVILFSPETTNIILGEPESRRNYLDQIISQYDLTYSDALQKFEKIIRQRNFLLKSLKKNYKSSVVDTLSVWNSRLAKYSENITAKRAKLVQLIEKYYSGIYNCVAKNNNTIKTELLQSVRVNEEAEIARQLEENLEKDILLGFTTIGAQKDDLLIEVDEFSAKGNLSQGEIWTLAFTLVMVEHKIFTEKESTMNFQEPVLLLDDVFLGIDQKRRQKVVEFIEGKGQVIITSALEREIPKDLKFNRIDVKLDE
ncbi:MAG: DNA replication and repair protein RecF [Candidatus Ancillula trichonymphae]|jgi:DNA replication and repair protein RecF|nr:DNA replication and repair protein RecF [Candidatus Ancillula trichonymphae]